MVRLKSDESKSLINWMFNCTISSVPGRKQVVLIFWKSLLWVEEEAPSLAHSTSTSKRSVSLFLHSLVGPPQPGVERLEPKEDKTLACCQSQHSRLCGDMLLRAYFGINSVTSVNSDGAWCELLGGSHSMSKGHKIMRIFLCGLTQFIFSSSSNTKWRYSTSILPMPLTR